MNMLHYFVIFLCILPIISGLMALMNPLDFNPNFSNTIEIRTPYFNSKYARISKSHWDFAQKEYGKRCVITGFILIPLNLFILLPIFINLTKNTSSNLIINILFFIIIIIPYFVILLLNTKIIINNKLKNKKDFL